MLNGLKHLDCISQVGYVPLHARYKLPFAKKMIRQFDSGPLMLEEPQSPASFSCSPSMPPPGVLGLGRPGRVGGGQAPPAALHLCIVKHALEVPHTVVLPVLPCAFLLRFSFDLPEGVRGSRII